MQSHRIDPLSAALGVLTVIAGIAVMFGATWYDLWSPSNALTWIALVALVLGASLIPWRARTSANRVVPGTTRLAGEDGADA